MQSYLFQAHTRRELPGLPIPALRLRSLLWRPRSPVWHPLLFHHIPAGRLPDLSSHPPAPRGRRPAPVLRLRSAAWHLPVPAVRLHIRLPPHPVSRSGCPVLRSRLPVPLLRHPLLPAHRPALRIPAESAVLPGLKRSGSAAVSRPAPPALPPLPKAAAPCPPLSASELWLPPVPRSVLPIQRFPPDLTAAPAPAARRAVLSMRQAALSFPEARLLPARSAPSGQRSVPPPSDTEHILLRTALLPGKAVPPAASVSPAPDRPAPALSPALLHSSPLPSRHLQSAGVRPGSAARHPGAPALRLPGSDAHPEVPAHFLRSSALRPQFSAGHPPAPVPRRPVPAPHRRSAARRHPACCALPRRPRRTGAGIPRRQSLQFYPVPVLTGFHIPYCNSVLLPCRQSGSVPLYTHPEKTHPG